MNSAVKKRPRRPAPLPEPRELSVGEKRRRLAQVASGLRWKDIATHIERRTGKPTSRQQVENVVKDLGRSRRVADAFVDLMIEHDAVFDGADRVTEREAAFLYLFPEYPGGDPERIVVGVDAGGEPIKKATAANSEESAAVAP